MNAEAPLSLTEASDRARLVEVWEASVRATHTFLSEGDFQALLPLVRQLLSQAEGLHAGRDADGRVLAFMGLDGEEIAMLFVHPDHFGQGWGRRLVHHAIHAHGARRVDVNEQNPMACGFYEHLGFRKVGRSERDGQGNPFPILHLALPPQEADRGT